MEATALEKKLILSLLVQVLMVRHLFPDGKWTNNWCPW